MVELYQPPSAWGLPTISPFCHKVGTYLKMTKVQHEVKLADYLKAPNGRVPYIKINGEVFGDSSLIIEKLKSLYGNPLDENLGDFQIAQAQLLQHLVEERIYYSMVWLRWSKEGSWKYVQDAFKGQLPPVIGGLILKIIRKDMKAIAQAHGLLELGEDHMVQVTKKDLKAISVILGDKPYFLGDKPASIDATMYSFLTQLLWVPWNCPIKSYGLSLENLSGYCDRIKAEFWA